MFRGTARRHLYGANAPPNCATTQSGAQSRVIWLHSGRQFSLCKISSKLTVRGTSVLSSRVRKGDTTRVLRASQPAKALDADEVNPPGKVTDARLVHTWKAHGPTEVTPSGKVTDLRL